MTFWSEVWAIFIGDIFASGLVILFYMMIQWFLHTTDVTVGYSWKWEGTKLPPIFLHPQSICNENVFVGKYLLHEK